jgi:hypothetical protein
LGSNTAELDQDAADKGGFACFRFYGPTQPYFDRTWTLPDIVEVK